MPLFSYFLERLPKSDYSMIHVSAGYNNSDVKWNYKRFSELHLVKKQAIIWSRRRRVGRRDDRMFAGLHHK